VRLIFLIILGVNISFFLWEYRQGAPARYLPKNVLQEEDIPPRIFLLTELAEELLVPPVLVAQKILPKEVSLVKTVVEAKVESQKMVQLPVVLEPKKLLEVEKKIIPLQRTEPLIEQCYLLVGSKKTEFKTLFSSYQADVVSIPDSTVKRHYWVLTKQLYSSKTAKQILNKLKVEGVADAFLFTRGDLKGRISLGLFASPKNATEAKKRYSTTVQQALEIVLYKHNKQRHVLKVTLKSKHIADFKHRFKRYLDEKINCAIDSIAEKSD